MDWTLARELAEVGEALQDAPGARLIADPTDTLVMEGLLEPGDQTLVAVRAGMLRLLGLSGASAALEAVGPK